jgi:hypothetical protein
MATWEVASGRGGRECAEMGVRGGILKGAQPQGLDGRKTKTGQPAEGGKREEESARKDGKAEQLTISWR